MRPLPAETPRLPCSGRREAAPGGQGAGRGRQAAGASCSSRRWQNGHVPGSAPGCGRLRPRSGRAASRSEAQTPPPPAAAARGHASRARAEPGARQRAAPRHAAAGRPRPSGNAAPAAAGSAPAIFGVSAAPFMALPQPKKGVSCSGGPCRRCGLPGGRRRAGRAGAGRGPRAGRGRPGWQLQTREGAAPPGAERGHRGRSDGRWRHGPGQPRLSAAVGVLRSQGRSEGSPASNVLRRWLLVRFL